MGGLTFPQVPRPEDVIAGNEQAKAPPLDREWLVRTMDRVTAVVMDFLPHWYEQPNAHLMVRFAQVCKTGVSREADRAELEQWQYHYDAVTTALRLKGWIVQYFSENSDWTPSLDVTMSIRDQSAIEKHKLEQLEKKR